MPIFYLYRALTTLGGPAIDILLRHRQRHGKEDAIRLGERLGHPGLPRPRGPLVWTHGASVGEAKALLPLISALLRQRPGLSILLTTGTVTSARVVANALPEGAVHQFLPVDKPSAVRRFLEHWDPDLTLWSESDFWPNLLVAAGKRGKPMVLLNGRISDRSHVSWRRHRGLAKRMMAGFSLCLGQTDRDARRLAEMGAPRVDSLGNLKCAAPPDPADPTVLAQARAALGDRPRWLAASTHAGEEALAGRTHAALKARFPTLLTVIVPRHAERSESLAESLRAQGLTVTRRSEGWPGPETDILLGDTMGEMGLYYRLAPIVVMGKTLTKTGGQNPLEPALLDSALLWGPGMTNFAELALRLRAAGAAQEVADEAALTEAVNALLEYPDRAADMARAARLWAEGEGAVLERILETLAPYLDPLVPIPPHRPLARPLSLDRAAMDPLAVGSP
ncbi:MAG: 3-deoxy-D-manno-octulosonic acid transferase [Rhodospirillum sp.]|nr:3-deoxy-D-manno-octulosonic acid transferase [Rhodospirillum sp.]MCF8488978.1 3-deoxy-D-manno-octulosonic acid transferase [Rhodospirillum sp.]MCF8500019.1 3-deoxy-D-manno-octulosonic acid transferase [Rhodospirillum sp.]